jgi:hypothetical protein
MIFSEPILNKDLLGDMDLEDLSVSWGRVISYRMGDFDDGSWIYISAMYRGAEVRFFERDNLLLRREEYGRVGEITSNFRRLYGREANFYLRHGTLVGLALALD